MGRRGIRTLALALACALVLGLSSAPALADDDTFEIVYKTNAGVEMGTVTYTVGAAGNAFPALEQFSTYFNAFLQRAAQKGSIYLPSSENARWYSDQALTQVAAFPQGEPGETYTIYCRFTTGLYVSDISNGAEDENYSAVGGSFQPNLSVDYSIQGRNDVYPMGTEPVVTFERLVGGAWVEVDERYYTDYRHNTWPNIIWFSSVADSGTYRLKHLRYTATDIAGNVLFYDTVYDPAGADKTYTVKISPVELTIDGVQAVGRPADGTTGVALTGGTLNGVLFGDDVSFELGTGAVADGSAGADKPVTTDIRLTGSAAGNYTLAQPTGLTVTLTACQHGSVGSEWKADAQSHWHVCNLCGAQVDLAAHSFAWVIDRQATATESGKRHQACTVCGYVGASETIPATGTDTDTDTGTDDEPEIPETGDGAQPTLWLLLAGLSGAALLGSALRRRRGQNG